MSDIDTTADLGEGSGRKAQAKAAIGQAGQALKSEAQTFAAAAQERARTEALRGAEVGAKTLGDFANAIRRAGDELSQTDQSPAARLIGQAADGLENLSRNLAGKQPEELMDAVRDFGRRHPAAFIGGAVLAGIALGRFVRASDDEPSYAGGGVGAYPIASSYDDLGSDDLEVGIAGGLASAPSSAAAGPISDLDASLAVQGVDAEVDEGGAPLDDDFSPSTRPAGT